MANNDIEVGTEGAYDSIDTAQMPTATRQGGNRGQSLCDSENNNDQRDHSRSTFETNSMSRVKDCRSSSFSPFVADAQIKDVPQEWSCPLHPNITNAPHLHTLIFLVLGGAVATAFLVLVIICPVLLAALKQHHQQSQHPSSGHQEQSAQLLKVHDDDTINRLLIDHNTMTIKQNHAEVTPVPPERLQKPSILPQDKRDQDLTHLDHLYLHVANSTLQAIDLTANPCDNFYQFACGNWGTFNPPPPGVSRWSVFEKMTVTIWEMMEDELQVETPHLLSSADPELLQKVRTYYKVCQDEEKLENMGSEPLLKLLDNMDNIYEREMKNLQGIQSSERSWQLKLFQRILEYTHNMISVPALFTFSIQPDTTHTSKMAIQLTFPTIDLVPQGSIVAGNQELIRVYRNYANQLISAVKPMKNQTLVDQDVDDIIQMLTLLKPVAGSPLLNETNVEELNEIAPFLDWKLYFTTAFNNISRINWKEERILSQAQTYLHSISSIIIKEISTVGLRRLYTYLQWQVMQYYGHYLHKVARNAILPLFDGLSGSNTTFIPHFKLKPCIKELEEHMPIPMVYLMQQAIKQIISQNTDNNANSLLSILKEAKKMAESIQLEYMNYFQKFQWMNYEARKFLIDKIANVKVLIGYPDIINEVKELKDLYKHLTITNESLLQNQHQILLFNTNKKLQQLVNPELYDEWSELSPMSLVTFYVYRRNSLLVPLGGIRYPLFHPELPGAFNYAGLGVLIAHELGHSVDFVGRTRDRFGHSNSSIWPTEVVEEFVTHLTCRINQYKAHYHSFDNILTVAEIMADDASVTAAYEAVKSNLLNGTYPSVLWDNLQQLNLNAHQLFFLHYAQNFCTSYSPPDAKPVGVDHYPPHSVRIRATLANTPAFSEAFRCPSGSPMNPNWPRCEIW